jgi:hypothetical protein
VLGLRDEDDPDAMNATPAQRSGGTVSSSTNWSKSRIST